jgi:hypothetical protein
LTVKEQLRDLVERLDDDTETIEEALDYLRWLASDEPEELTPEELADVEEAEAAFARGGEGIPLEEALRSLGGE